MASRFHEMKLANYAPGEMAKRVMIGSLHNESEEAITYSAFGDATPDKVITALQSSENDQYLTDLMRLFTAMKADPDIYAALQFRYMAGLSKEAEIQPTGEAEPDPEVMAYAKAITVEHEQWSMLNEDILDAIPMGLSVSEVNTYFRNFQGRDLLWPSFVFKPQELFRWEKGRLVWVGTGGKEEYLPPDKYLVTVCRGIGKRPNHYGILRALALPYLLKAMTFKEWGLFVRKWGMAAIWGMLDNTSGNGTTGGGREEFARELNKMASGSTGAFPNGAQINLLEPNRQGSIETYSSLVEVSKKMFEKVILGTALATENYTTGSRSNSQSGMDITDMIVRADCVQLREPTVNRYLKYMIWANFPDYYSGRRTDFPVVKFKVDPAEDLEVRSRVDTAVQKMGASIYPSYIQKTYGYPEPKAGEAPLTAPVQPSPFGPSPSGGETPPAANSPQPSPPGGGGKLSPFDQGGLTAPASPEAVTLSEEIELAEEDRAEYEALCLANPGKSAFVLADVAQFVGVAKRSADPAMAIFEDRLREYAARLFKGNPGPQLVLARLHSRPDSFDFSKRLGESILSAQQKAMALARKQVGKYADRAKVKLSLADPKPPVKPPKPRPFLPTKAMDFWETASYAVADYEDGKLWESVQTTLRDVIKSGESLGGFQDNFVEALRERGLEQLSPGRVYTIYETNTATAYSAERYAAQADAIDLLPKVEFTAVLDDVTRPEHAALDGLVTEFGSAEHHKYNTPLDYNCRCQWIPADSEATSKEGASGAGFHPPFAGQPDTGLVDWIQENYAFADQTTAKYTGPDGYTFTALDSQRAEVDAALADATEARGWLRDHDSIRAYIGPKAMLVAVNNRLVALYGKDRPKHSPGVLVWRLSK